jgi:hypothetical protein
MSGIPVYTASKPTGITPQTALTPDQTSQTPSKPAPNTAGPTTAAAPVQSTLYAPAQPGAAAVPTPTQAVQPRPSQTQPTSLTTVPTLTQPEGPPPPQPGAVPSSPQPTGRQRASVPPPPKAGETVRAPEYYAPAPHAATSQTAPQAMPPQWQQQFSNPTRAQPPASTTSAYETGRGSLDHPPGYIQNPNAAADNVVNPPVRPLEGLGVGGGDASVMGDEPGVWDTAKRWAFDAAGKVGEMENEVWRRINGEEK